VTRGAGQAWLTHCYGAIGVGADEEPDSGNGAGLYVVIGHAPRHSTATSPSSGGREGHGVLSTRRGHG